MDMKQHFDAISKDYDQQRRQLIPCFDDFYHLPLTVLDYKGETPKILDIGSGTGLFASIVMEKKYPKAHYTLIDLSDKMLEMARGRFSGLTNVEYIVADYTQHEFMESYDIIISALSIHHLTAKDKENLYHKCFGLLNPEGVFVNADQVLSPSPQIEGLFADLIRKSVESSGLSKEEVDRAYERMQLDDPSTLQEQLTWLKQAGFRGADCIYKYYTFCVMYAKK